MCALFYDYNAQVPPNHRHVSVAWGELDPVVAIGLENKEIHFFTDEGEKVPNAAIYSRSADIVLTTWQPRGHALAVGWSDGMVSLWVHKDNTSREVNSPHTGRITLLKWAAAGNRLLSADETGLLAVWKVDARAQLSLATTYTRQGSLTHLAFATASTTHQRKPLATTTTTTTTAMSGVCPSFFFGGEIGSVHYADDLGHISDVQVFSHAVDAMMFYEEQSSLVVITRAQQLVVFQIDATDGKVKPTVRFKLSIASDGALRETKWAGPGLLAIASGEPLIRFWDMQADENSVLNLPKLPGVMTRFQVSSIDFSPQRRILAAATTQGHVFFWRCTSIVVTASSISTSSSSSGKPPTAQAVTLSHRWDLLFTSSEMKASIARIGWSSSFATLYVATTEGAVVLFHEGSMQRALCGDTAVIQSRPTVLSIERFRDGTILQSTLEASLRIKGVSHDSASLVVWNGSKAEVFELRNDSASGGGGGSNETVKRVAQFKCMSTAMVLRGDSIYRAQGNHVEICNMQGVVKKTISFTEAEGKPELLSVQNKFLAVATDRGLLRVFDLKSRDPKAMGSMGNFLEAFQGETKKASMRAITVNADGSRVAILAERMEGALKIRMPVSKLYLFQSDLNIFQQYDFGVNRFPLSVFFDPIEPRLLACETYKTRSDPVAVAASASASTTNKAISGGESEESGPRTSALSEKEVIICFASNDHGILMQDSFDLDLKYSALLGIQVPRIYLIANADGAASDYEAAGFSYLRLKTMRDFVGLDKLNETARAALIDFCYFMTIGNMDEAYRSVKLIENASVWENMAHMCVKTKRLDVAEVCLGNMGHARGAAAVSEAKQGAPPLEVPIAMVAIQLGLRDEAASLYRQCGRFDQLNRLYQASGYWQKAIDVAAKRDRIHLKTTYYQMAQHHEALGEIKEAMEAYEDAGTHHKDIPRMLLKLDKLELLQKYVATSNDRALLIWWAQFQESQGHLDLAIESYQRAHDDLSVVRVLCFKKDFQAAAKVVEHCPRNRAAAYHLARQFEAMGEIATALRFYALGACYSHTIRLAREHQMDAELMSFALMSTPSDMLDCAAYFEARRDMEKAVQLYHKGGHVARALELCFSAQLFDELHVLTDELGPTTSSPAMLKRCADFFMANGHFAKAVHLLLVAGRTSEALDVCLQHKVKITDDMAEKMTPPKDESGNGSDDKVAQKKRTELLLKLAKCCKHQGAFHLATKKYTQAGDKVKAMKCLLKSGDTEKVVFFANVSRNNAIYVLAANYLQTLDWRKDAETLKSIVGFYTKARALEQLASFYQSCAQAEMDDFRDYAKALGALHEAANVLAKAKGDAKERLQQALETKIRLVEQFVTVRQMQQTSASEVVAVLTKLLAEPGIDDAIRIGDAYAMIVEAHYQDGNLRAAYAAMEDMKARRLTVKNYVDPRIVQEVQQKMGGSSGGGGDDDSKRRESKRSPRDGDDEDGGAKASEGGRQPVKAPPREDDGEVDDDMEEDIAEDD